MLGFGAGQIFLRMYFRKKAGRIYSANHGDLAGAFVG
jgi:hypothetical protein